MFPPRRFIQCLSDESFDEKLRGFKFSSIWNKIEAMYIIHQIQIENVLLEKIIFYAIPEKSQRIEEFATNQLAAGNNLATLIKETWINAITSSVRQNLKDVKKGWFNIDEDNLEVYKFSKLRRFMCRINFKLEDVIRDMMYRTVADYCTMIKQFCPQSIKIISKDSVEIIGGKFPLFTVDLKFINTTPQAPAQFVYSTTAEALFNAIMVPFDHIFKSLKGIVKIERRVMKKLFWVNSRILYICLHII